MLQALELFDGACCLMEGRAKPRPWTDAMVKVAKAFSSEDRGTAAAAAQVSQELLGCFEIGWECMSLH